MYGAAKGVVGWPISRVEREVSVSPTPGNGEIQVMTLDGASQPHHFLKLLNGLKVRLR